VNARAAVAFRSLYEAMRDAFRVYPTAPCETSSSLGRRRSNSPCRRLFIRYLEAGSLSWRKRYASSVISYLGLGHYARPTLSRCKGLSVFGSRRVALNSPACKLNHLDKVNLDIHNARTGFQTMSLDDFDFSASILFMCRSFGKIRYRPTPIPLAVA